MVVHIAESEGRTVLIKSHLRDCELQWHKALASNAWLHQQLALLTTEVQVQLTLSCSYKSCFRLRNSVCTVWKCDSTLLISYSTCYLGFQVLMQHQYMCMVSDKVQTVLCVFTTVQISAVLIQTRSDSVCLAALAIACLWLYQGGAGTWGWWILKQLIS